MPYIKKRADKVYPFVTLLSNNIVKDSRIEHKVFFQFYAIYAIISFYSFKNALILCSFYAIIRFFLKQSAL